MDHVIDEGVRERGRLEAIARALGDGVVLVDRSGEILWIDRATRRRIDGELGKLDLPLPRPAGRAIDCFAAPVDLTVNGERLSLCVLQEADARADSGQDLLAALETIMADSASWLTRTVLDKLKAIGRPVESNGPARGRDLDLLSDREREVLGLICEGKSGTAIGDILGLSENTVRNHIASLYRKIGVNRRSGAIIWARERGITGRDSIAIGRAGRNRERARQAQRLLGD
ncbi:LuxR C-terminal-related transcriptional regulator [Enhydrobacter sp.]|jgi:DNA-binding CsgD family transcriptional regulator|uniref:helix-turn-helix transcriptional regulator n=1 Tax=Enhydrobacter sp. TaxID=1894999 RepID=UPI00262349B9|nr:LuxR C-terminal-related transcriptional regulator [Enhydrobacter sp.]WIM09320.1 MAG: Sensory box transcriptional regulator, LuxR family [Enhydrobacter sp.]